MDFEWDNQKNNANIAKHGIDFEFAKEIFRVFGFQNLTIAKIMVNPVLLPLGVWKSLLSLLSTHCEGRKYVLSL
jgi:hypothetical protein